MTTLNVAIMICDTPHINLLSNYGDYNKLFTDLLNSVNIPNLTVKTSAFDCTQGQQYFPEIGTYDVFLITGSKLSVKDQVQWIIDLNHFVTKLVEADSIIIGICFGAQMLAHALGGTVEPNPLGWEAGYSQINLTPKGKMIFGKETISIHQMHKEIITELRNQNIIVSPRI